MKRSFDFLESKMMYADIEDFALDAAKYYHKLEDYKKLQHTF